ncbi:CLUMA_CG001499, isoform A [Clunio marinus]|uniref:CLUMA_CG001499, isoform A n=1 Tax=Clunio marinus TaxID=568069 RepID=A0A1J1HI71_9DIPT|nr:CLUMA_CG001499, isoform A [Clunio marinus]
MHTKLLRQTPNGPRPSSTNERKKQYPKKLSSKDECYGCKTKKLENGSQFCIQAGFNEYLHFIEYLH